MRHAGGEWDADGTFFVPNVPPCPIGIRRIGGGGIGLKSGWQCGYGWEKEVDVPLGDEKIKKRGHFGTWPGNRGWCAPNWGAK
jgi:hypothetical protein